MRTTSDLLQAIAQQTGNGDSAKGFEIFQPGEVLHSEHLHRDYCYADAVRYLMRMRPDDAGRIEQETRIEP